MRVIYIGMVLLGTIATIGSIIYFIYIKLEPYFKGSQEPGGETNHE